MTKSANDMIEDIDSDEFELVANNKFSRPYRKVMVIIPKENDISKLAEMSDKAKLKGVECNIQGSKKDDSVIMFCGSNEL